MKKWRAGICIGVMLGLFSASSSFAKEYGMAGCGLGSLVVKDKPGAIQIVGAILNDILFPQTFAITTGTSNCSHDMSHAALFISINRDALAKDIARGQGETLDGLTRLMGCSDPSAVGNSLQQHYSEIFPAADVSSLAIQSTIQSTLESDKTLSAICEFSS